MKSAASYKTKTTRWLWEGRMPLGEITLVAGREGAGKGLLMSHMVAQITRGKLPGQYYGTPQSVAIAAHEDSWEKTIVPRLKAAGADLSRVFHPLMSDHDEVKDRRVTRKIVFPDDLPSIVQMARQAGVVMLVLDPLMSTLAAEIDIYKSSKVRPVMEEFRTRLERADIACFGIVHFNKMAEGDALTKIAGGRGIVEVSRAALILAEDKSTDPGSEGVIIVSQPRNNLGRTDLPNLAFIKEGKDIITDDGHDANVGKLIWVSYDYKKNADDALSTRNDGRTKGPTDYTKVIDFMREADRPVTAVDVADATKVPVTSVRVIFGRANRANTIERVTRGAYKIADPT
jgi:hypothetical protein